MRILVNSKGPFTLVTFAAISAAISSAISNRPCKLLAGFKSPVI